jgi:uncharacterized protein with PIN domain
MKFITDANLGKLAKWLRILGYDTIIYKGIIDRDFLKKAEKEERVALTRKRDMSTRQFSGQLVIVYSDDVHEQLKEIMRKLSFYPESDHMFSICTHCNELLVAVEKEEISGIVPEHIFASHTEFHVCPRCKGVFWPGTHVEKAHRFFRTHIQNYRP